LQDELRRDGFKVVGGSAYGDHLENDRALAQRTLEGLGLPTLQVVELTSVTDATTFLARKPGRYVLKFNGSGFRSSSNYVGRLDDGSDVLAVLKAQVSGAGDGPYSFVLMEYVDGVEMGVGAYFDGQRFIGSACLDWEHKRFFPGDLGELTGEMGTVATFDGSSSFFDRTLAKMTPLLREGGYCGYINLNTIVNEQGIWPLEFTTRFGYPGYAVLEPLQALSWGELFKSMVTRSAASFETRPGFSVGVLMTTPPFPYTREEIDEVVGLPVMIEGPLTDEDSANIHYGEVGLAGGDLVTSGIYGWTLVVTGGGSTIDLARAEAYRRIRKVTVPNGRYRLDIGTRLSAGGYQRVEALGLLDEPD
jgi:phosphoribosylamine--glycine ligase